MTTTPDTAEALSDPVLAFLDALGDDAAAHMYPEDIERCSSSECAVTAFSVRVGSPEGHSEPLFTRAQVADALRASAARVGEAVPVATFPTAAEFFDAMKIHVKDGWFEGFDMARALALVREPATPPAQTAAPTAPDSVHPGAGVQALPKMPEGVNAQLLEALKMMEAEKSDYMRRNNLGDPAREHTNQIARAAIAAAEAGK